MALRVEYRPLSAIVGNPANPKSHDLGALHVSMDAFGYLEPIIEDGRTGRLVAGHGRVATLQQKRQSGDQPPEHIVAEDGDWLVPVVVGWESTDDSQAQRAGLVANRAVELGGWDKAALASLLADLEADGGLDATGFDADDLEALLRDLGEDKTAGFTDPDAVPEPPAEPVTKPGDVWLIGDHRLVCGDATDLGAYDLLLQGTKADMLWTDPPYGVSYEGGSRPRTPIVNDALTDEELRAFLVDALGFAASHVTAGGAFYVCSPAGPTETTFRLALPDCGLVHRQTLVWVKNNSTFGPLGQDYHWRHESILYGHRQGAAHCWYGDRTQDTAWEIARPAQSEDHPTMKPVELVARALANSSPRGALVLDPFAGSGTTLIAALGLSRRAALVELEPRYCDVILKRAQQHTGVVPVLEATGEPHDFA